MNFSAVRWQMMTYKPYGSANEEPSRPRPSPTYVKKLESAKLLRPNAACTMRPPSTLPTGSNCNACVMSPHQPAMTSGDTSTSVPRSAPSPRATRTILPSKRLPWNSCVGTATKPSPATCPEWLRNRPTARKVVLINTPASGPAAATSQRVARSLSMEVKGVIAPKEPIWRLGTNNVGPSFTSLMAAAMRCPASWAMLTPNTALKMGIAVVKYGVGSHDSKPGGSSLDSKLAGLANHSRVSFGSFVTLAASASCPHEAMKSRAKITATACFQLVVSGGKA
mmetsp:Transcript_9292/g.16413  ORF Transcript_9292/g.16413 Transcript_9292/m.16413 type:complete len:280 (-) Transcript_9292:1050-1889(-)